MRDVSGTEEFLASRRIPDHIRIRGLVILTHYQLTTTKHSGVVAALASLAQDDRAVLILHGHDHPHQYPGKWVESEELGSLTVSRSHLCSSASNEGWGHHITWQYGKFAQRKVRTPWVE